MDRKRRATLSLALVACIFSSSLRAADCEDLIARHMTGQAMLAAQFDRLAADAMTMRAFVLHALREKGLDVNDEDLVDLRKRRD